jgi:hypothetical protein
MRKPPISAGFSNIKLPLILAAWLAALVPAAVAQKTPASARSGVRHLHSPATNFAASRGAHRSGVRRSSPYASPYSSLPFPFLGDSFDPNDIYSSGYPVASQPPPFLMEALRGMAGPAADSMSPAASPLNPREPSSSEPLMIELQNGRYVRVNRSAADGEASPLASLPENPQSANMKSARLASSRSAQHAVSNSTQPTAIATSTARELPAAVLIFQDGHRVEVRDYSIAEGALYARGDFYTDGYWSKKIDLSTLNVAQTQQANLERNVKFVLPSSPNEVITRP